MKRAYLTAPCPIYDIEGMESWLSGLAEKGLFLSSDGFLFGFGFFDKGEPKKMRYRLEPGPKRMGVFDTPSEEITEAYAEFGWSYVCKHGQFLIYCAEDENAAELHTDTTIQAFALNKLRKRQITDMVFTLIYTLLYPILLLRGNLLLLCVHGDAPLVILGGLLMLYLAVDAVCNVVRLSKLRRKLLSGTAPDHSKKLKSGLGYRLRQVIVVLLIVGWVGGLLGSFSRDTAYEGIPTAQMGEVPFATLTDLFGEDFTETDFYYTNYCKTYHDLLITDTYEWSQAGQSGEHSGGMNLHWHKTGSTVMAQLLYRDYVRQAKFGGRRYEPMELTLVGTDEYFAYRDGTHFPQVVFRKGNVVVSVLIYQTSEKEIPFELLAQQVVDKIA